MHSRFLRIARMALTIAPFTLALTAADCSEPMAPTNNQTTVTAPIIALRAPAANATFSRANGKAKFENQGGERELEIEVEDVPAGTAMVFYLGDTEIARATADSFGNARINLNSDRGAVVPASVAGKTVTVRTPAGQIVVSGSF